MIFALLTLLAALLLAAVAGWFSIIGFMAIYAGAPMYALIMGVVMECAKLVTTSWIYRNWSQAGWKLKGPLIYFTLALMVATSIGVFGFLSKAHLEQGSGTIDNSAKIEQLQYQIEREKAIIVDNEKLTKQLDDTVNSLLGKDRADRAFSIRKSQTTQRAQLRTDTAEAQKRIDGINAEKFKLESEVRKMQLDVGPIRYIAELFYGVEENATKNIEAAVRIFTLLIVSSLDPLAVILLVAANHTLIRLQDEKGKKLQESQQTTSDAGQYRYERSSEIGPPSNPGLQDNSIHLRVGDKIVTASSDQAATPTEIHVSVPTDSLVFLNEVKEATTSDIDTHFNGTPSISAAPNSTPNPPTNTEDAFSDIRASGRTATEANEIQGLPGEEIIKDDNFPQPTTEQELSAAPQQSLNREEPDEESQINVQDDSLSEEVLKKFTPATGNITFAGVKQPAPTRVSSLSPVLLSGSLDEVINEQDIPDSKLPTLSKTPIVNEYSRNNDTIFREILGYQPHFVPTKVIKSEKSEHVTQADLENHIKDQFNGTPTPLGNKYPRALSWLSEFKRT